MIAATLTTVLWIGGMPDNRAREIVADALEGADGVLQVSVNLIRGRAVVVHRAICTPSDLIERVTRAGYEATCGTS